MTNRKYEIPDDVLRSMTLLDRYFPTNAGNPLGIECYLQEVDGEFYLRMFHLHFDETEQEYIIVDELPAIKFKTEQEVAAFSNNLPNMNGIEMMLFMNQSKIFHNFQFNARPRFGDANNRLI